ncbi:digestive organ expansion factor [Paraphysoderma sedebokerense]|nr:digestive organ expansion factor [Paraphysoderma sedebokerense]
MYVKHRIVEAWRKRSVKLKKIETGRETTLEGLPKALFEVMMQYQDLIFTNRCWTNSLSIQETYCLHALNHVFKTRSQILKHNAKFSSNEGDDMIEIRDQGFTRPKVLLLLPFRNTAFDVINTILSLSSVDQVENKKRFSDEFGPPTDDTMTADKPEDFKQTFRGNIDDCFKIGVKFTRKSAKLYSDFYSSDIIIASPIGLRMIVGSEGDKNRDYDFLSSIEVLVIDQANHLLMQNWDHLTHILDHVNLIPTKDHDCDFSRIKGYYVDGSAKYVRQTLVFSEFSFPELVSLSNKYCLNAAGRIRIKSEEFEGTIVNVIPRVKQVFQRTPVDDLESMQDVRFQWFIYNQTLPLLKSATSTQPHTLIFIPEYFDYVRVRNYLDENDWNFEAICEYSDSSEIARSRTLFFQNRTPILLYTERAHFFRRFKIRGIKNLVFYSLPTHADFYSEIVNFLTLPGPDGEITSELEMNVNVTFCKFDMMKLERVVGSKRCKKMMADPRGQFLFA